MYTYITSFDQTGNFFKDLVDTPVIGLDTETTSLDYLGAVSILLQIKIKDGIYIFDLRKIEDRHIVYILDLIQSSNKIVIGHNIKYDLQILYNKYKILLTNVYDTMLGEVLINQGLGFPLISLKEVIKRYTGREISKETRKEFYDNPDIIITQEILIYSMEDVQFLEEIREKQLKALEESKQLRVVELEMKLVPVTAMMEYHGVLIDIEKWESINKNVAETRIRAENELLDDIMRAIPYYEANNALDIARTLKFEPKAKYKQDILESITETDKIKDFIRNGVWVESKYGKNKGSLMLLEGINVASNDQILAILNVVYDLNVKDTLENTLRSIPDAPAVVNKLLFYREYAKKSSAYGEGLLEKIHPKTGRLHAKFNQLGAASGRYSSDSPNLQNIPRPSKSDTGDYINYRSCFIAGDGYKYITIDYAQQEYRLIGCITGEKKIIDAYKAEKDLHTLTGSIVNNVSLEAVTKEQRTNAKPVNFGVFYGSTAYGLSYNLGISLDEATRIYDALMDGIPTFRAVRDAIQEKVLEKLYSVTLLGRRRYFAKKTLFVDSGERYKYINRIKREGFNHCVQGTGADITKLAMIGVFYENPFGDDLKLLLAEHDEIVCQVKDECVEEAFEFIKTKMIEAEQPFLGEIPAVVDGVISDSWEKS